MRPIAIGPMSRWRAGGVTRLAVIVAAALASVGAGWYAASGGPLAAVVIAGLALLTGALPVIVPALLLVGLGFLHLLSYLLFGLTTRADVLASPEKFLPLVLAIFAPPVLVVLFREGRLVPLGALQLRDPRAGLLVGVFVLLLLLALGTGHTPTPVYGLTKTASFAAFSAVPALLVVLIVRQRAEAEGVVRGVFWIGVLWVLVVLGVAIGKGSLNLYHGVLGEFLGGASQSAGGLGGRAALVGLAGFGIALSGDRHWRRYLIGSALAVTVLVLSGHRTSVAAFAVGLLVIWFLTWQGQRQAKTIRSRTALAALVLAIACLFTWTSAPDYLVTRYLDPFESVAFQHRLVAQRIAVEGWAQAPLLGHGTGSSAYLITGADQQTFGALRGLYPHNVIVELMAELGLLGLAVYLITVVRVWLAGYKTPRDEIGTAWLMPVLLGTVAFAIAASLGWGDLSVHSDLWISGAILAVAASDKRLPRD